MKKVATRIMTALAMLICCMCLSLGQGEKVQASASYSDLALGKWLRTDSTTKDVDTRYYSVTLPKSGYLTVNVNAFFGGCEVYVYDEDLTTTVIGRGSIYGSDSAPGTYQSGAWLEKGTYLIRIRSFRSEYGNFWVKASFKAAGNNESEPNNTYAKPTSLKLNQKVRGLLSVQDTDDYYAFVLPKARKVTVQLTSYFSRCRWEVRNADLEVIQEGSLYGTESAPRVSNIELDLKAGKYYVRIYQGGQGYYDLVVKPEIILAKNVVMNRKSASIYKGSTLRLSATVSPSNTTNKKVTWRSSNTRVAKVNANGVVTGVGAGTAKITACTADGTRIAASCTVKVRNKTLTVNRSKVTLVRGKYYSLVVKGAPKVSPAAKTVKFSTSNSKIATVTSTGKIIAKRAGTCKIYVKGNGITRTVFVTVKNK